MLMDILAAMTEPAAKDSQADVGLRDSSPAMFPLSSPPQPPTLSLRETEGGHELSQSPSANPLSNTAAAAKLEAVASSTLSSPTTPTPPPPAEWRLLDVQVCTAVFFFFLSWWCNSVASISISWV